MRISSPPHFLLFSESDKTPAEDGRWRFLLESTDGETVVEASDIEEQLHGERLELLAVVRGLEALDQPSRVTLVTSCPRISRGFRFGLDEWRGNQWRWERDGRWIPIKNGDLWKRVDQTLKFHQVKCRTLRGLTIARQVSRGAKDPVAPALNVPAPVLLKNRVSAAIRAFFRADPSLKGLSPAGHLSN